MGAIQERLRTHGKRLDTTEGALAGVGRVQGDQATEIAVMRRDVTEIREDIKGLVQQVAWVRRGLWAAAGTFLMFVVALAALITQVSGG